MRHAFRLAVAAGLALGSTLAAVAQDGRPIRPRIYNDPESTGSFRLTRPLPYGYDTNSYNDRRPELAPYQQGGGQQTGGPARNLIPGDTLHFGPR